MAAALVTLNLIFAALNLYYGFRGLGTPGERAWHIAFGLICLALAFLVLGLRIGMEIES